MDYTLLSVMDLRRGLDEAFQAYRNGCYTSGHSVLRTGRARNYCSQVRFGYLKGGCGGARTWEKERCIRLEVADEGSGLEAKHWKEDARHGSMLV